MEAFYHFNGASFTSAFKSLFVFLRRFFILNVVIISFSFSSSATIYYVSTAGNDVNSGTSANLAWRSLAKVNSVNLKPGDRVLFRKGDTFNGMLQVKYSGTAGSPIGFGAYGSGSMPIISGLTRVSGWVSDGNGIYRAKVNRSDQLNLVLLNGKPVALGRYPNSGYLSFESSTRSTITDTGLTGQPYWKGAEVVVRSNHWVLDRNQITGHSGGTLTFTPSDYTPRAGFGYFIQSSKKTLDQFGEWYFSNGNLYMYFGSKSPDSYTIEAGVTDILAEMTIKNYLSFEGIEFKGANKYGFYLNSSKNIVLKGCKISLSGIDGVHAQGAENLAIEGNEIVDCLNNGIYTRWNSNNGKFIGNTIKNIGMLPGMGGIGTGAYLALYTTSKNAIIQYNTIDGIGYNGIHFQGDNTRVENNFVNNFCKIKDDGAGIYSFLGKDINFRFTGVKILNNIVLNGGGHEEGDGVGSTKNQVEGIYTDGLTNNFEISGNTVAYNASAGIFLNTPRLHNVHNNTLYANKAQQIQLNNLRWENARPGGNKINNNIFFSQSTKQYGFCFTSGRNDDLLSFGVSDANQFVTFSNDNLFSHEAYYYYSDGPLQLKYYSFSEWQTKRRHDLNSRHFMTQQDKHVFEYNASKSPKKITLRYPMVDVNGKKYSGSVTIAPYGSIILLSDPDGGDDGSSNIPSTEENISICEGDSYQGWTEAGQYERTLQSTSGTDSIVTTNLSINLISYRTEDIYITEGEDYYGWTSPGEYERILTSAAGCDSIVTTNLFVTQGAGDITPPTISSFVIPSTATTLTIPISNFSATDNNRVAGYLVSETSNTPLAEDTRWTSSAPSTYNFSQSGSKTLFAWVKDDAGNISGTKTATVAITLTTTTPDEEVEYVTICDGEEYFGLKKSGEYRRIVSSAQDNTTINGVNLITNNNFTSGIDGWKSWGATGYKINLSLDNKEFVSAPSSMRIDCDSNGDKINNLHLISGEKIELTSGKEYELSFYVKATSEFSIGKLIILKGSTPWTTYGAFSNNQPLVTTEWTQVKVIFTAAHSASDGSLRMYLGNSIPQGQAMYVDDFVFAETEKVDIQEKYITTHLTVNPIAYTTEEITISEGEEYQGWTETGEYERLLKSASGCDSIVTTHLKVEGKKSGIVQNITEDIIICEGNSYQDWNTEGQYKRTLQSVSGADSIVTTNLTVNPVYVVNEEITISEGEEYQSWTTTGQYQRILSSVSGCDSTVNTNLIVISRPEEVEYVTICEGEEYNGWTTTGVYQRTDFSDQDSTTLKGANLISNNNFTNGINDWKSWGAAGYKINLSLDNKEFVSAPSSMRIDCDLNGDKTNNLHLISGEKIELTSGKEYELSFYVKATSEFSIGKLIILKGSTPWTTYGAFSNNQPLVTTEWKQVKVTFTATHSASDGSLRMYLGNSIPQGQAMYVDDFVFAETEKVALQEKLITTHLTVNPIVYTTENITILDGEHYLNWTEPGEYERILTTSMGCDSVVTTNLEVIREKSNHHFIPVWENENGQNHMNINVVAAYNDGIQLKAGDEIGVFDGNLCVGAVKLFASIDSNKVNSYVQIHASQDDGRGNGFTEGNAISFKIWDSSEHLEIIANSVIYNNDLPEWNTSGNFTSGSTSVIEIGTTSVKEELLASQSIELTEGWNIFSSYLVPNNSNMAEVQEILRTDGQLIKVQNEVGNTYENWGANKGWINNIGDIQETQGYKIRVQSDCILEIAGQPISLPADITFKEGWNIISIPFDGTIDALDFLQPLIDAGILQKVQDEKGNSIEYWGESTGWINGIGNFVAGEGYKVQVKDNGVLPINGEYEKSGILIAENIETSYFNINYEGNGLDHMNININSLNESKLKVGDEIAAFDGETCVGAVKLTESHFINGQISVNASFSDENLKNGFVEGNSIELRIWRTENNKELNQRPDIIEGSMLFQRQASVFVKLNNQDAFDIQGFDSIEIDMYPNPANSNVNIRFSELPVPGTKIILSDIAGKKLIVREVQSTHEVLDIHSFPNGIYLINTVSGDNNKILKLIKN